MKRMLFNATYPEELRVAIVDGQRLTNLDIESAVRAEKKGNIYKATISKVEPALEAAFVNYGSLRQGFLPLKEIYRGYFQQYDPQEPITSVKIAEQIKVGQEVLVQVNRDERGNKGASLSTFICLAGRFLVLMPNNPKGGGISRRISGGERNELRHLLDSLNVGKDHALIARSAGIGRSQEELQWDLNFLLKLWETIENAAETIPAPSLIHQESNLIVRSIRDHLGEEITEAIVDEKEIYDRAKRFMENMMPQNLDKLRLYEEHTPLFSRFQIENQIESAFRREISLPSGGALIIDNTEALTAIDVNSARATKGADIEETALETNLEAVEEIARQLRIRDIGGLVVIDLIDMSVSKNQRTVEAKLKESLAPDRARVQVGKISRFGLLEMSRQRLRASVNDANYQVCPRCHGTGNVRSVISASLRLLRSIEDKATSEKTEALQVFLPLNMATYILNEQRAELERLEKRLSARIMVIPDEKLHSPQFEMKFLDGDELEEFANSEDQSADSVLSSENQEDLTVSLKSAPREKPHVQSTQIDHDSAPPDSAPTSRGGFFKNIFGFGGAKSDEAETTAQPSTPSSPRSNTRRPRKSPGRPRAKTGLNRRRTTKKSTRKTQPRRASGNTISRENHKPTRRDFAAHDPDQRVGKHRSASERGRKAAHPNRADPVREQEIPDDLGNRK